MSESRLTGQDIFIEPMKILGYPVAGGYCYAFSYLHLISTYSGTLDKFNQRLDLISENGYNIQFKIQEAQTLIKNLAEKAKHEIGEEFIKNGYGDFRNQFDGVKTQKEKNNLNNIFNQKVNQWIISNTPAEVQQWLDVLAFFDNLQLLQERWRYPDLLVEKTLDVHLFLPFAKSKILEQNEAESAFKESAAKNFSALTTLAGIYDRQEITQYLGNMQAFIDASPQLREPIILVLSSYNHAINITYNPTKKLWLLTNINALPSQEFNDLDKLAEKILTSFSFTPGPRIENVALITAMYAAPKEHEAAINKINSWKNDAIFLELHDRDKLSKEIDDFGISAATIEAYKYSLYGGSESMLKELLSIEANPKQTLLFMCAMGLTKGVEIMLDQGMDINFNEPSNPLRAAAGNGRGEIVKMLLKHKPRMNFKNKDKDTALSLTIQKVMEEAHRPYYLGISYELLHAATSLSDESKKTLVNALELFIEEGRYEFFKAITQGKGVDNILQDAIVTEKLNNAISIAADKGHINTLKLLLVDGVDLTQPLQILHGQSPLQVLLYNDDISSEDKQTLMKLIGEHATDEVKNKAKYEFIKSVLMQTDKFTPEDETHLVQIFNFAMQHGHSDILNLLIFKDAHQFFPSSEKNKLFNLIEEELSRIKDFSQEKNPSEISTLFRVVIENGNVDLIKLFLQKKVNIDIPDNRGKTPREYIQILDSQEVNTLVQNYGASLSRYKCTLYGESKEKSNKEISVISSKKTH